MIRTAYYFDRDLRMWIFLLIDGDDVLASGSEAELADAARRALKARQNQRVSSELTKVT